MKRTVIGIDVGGTTTKIVGFSIDGEEKTLISPQFVCATDPLTSTYGAFGKFTTENGLGLDQIHRIMVTGAGASVIGQNIYGLPCHAVPEFSSIGIGGLYLSGLDEAIVVSMGTGTALVHAKREGENFKIEYLGGTGVGGGTLMGLSRRMLGIDSVEHLETLCRDGDLNRVDLRIKDISRNHTYHGINENLTASNFGKVSDLATPADLALGLSNMVGETVAMIAMFAARSYQLSNIVLIGNLTTITPVREVFENLADTFGVRFIIPEGSQYGTVIGAALQKEID